MRQFPVQGENLLEDLKKSFGSYSKNPFPFVWGSMMYIFTLIAFFFAAIGVFLVYFIAMSVFNQSISVQSVPTIAVSGVVALIFIYFSCGLNAALAKSYRNALWKDKMGLTGFFSYALDKAPVMFAIMLMRDFIWLLFTGPVIAGYLYFLNNMEYVDILVLLYVLVVTFAIHLLFTPAFIYAGSLDLGLFASMKHAFKFLTRRHIYFIGLYVVFAVFWLVNFIPFLQIATIFFFYPVAYSALIAMVEGSVKLPKEED
jgi:hypothetical protein